MDEEGKARLCDEGKGCFQLLLVDHGEAVAAGVNEKTFEAEYTSVCQWKDVFVVVSDGSSPRSPVDKTLSLSGFALLLKCGDGCSFGEAVQRHIDQGGVAAGRGGTCCGAKTFPFSAAWLVDVD